jgi:predicted acyltransferase
MSLDAYRGFTMLAMVSAGMGTAHLLHDPTWGWLADQLEHRAWIGCTAWDLIQPSFMFMVGAAMPFAFARRRQLGQSWGRQFLHVLKRVLLLIAIGIFLDSYHAGVIYVQFIRVLQQIAIGYVLAFLVLDLGPPGQALTAALILIGHAAAYTVYGSAAGSWPWEKGHNLGTWVDELLHLPVSTGGYATLNALSSTATILFGVLCGELLRRPLPARTKLATLAAAGVGGLLLGLALSPAVPIIKRIWTSSFAVYAAGWTCLMMLAFYAIIDGLGWRRWAFPLVVVGMNSIAIYVAAGLLPPVIRRGLAPFVADPLRHVPGAAPVIMAGLVVLVEWGLCYWLYRQRIFFKV